MVVVNAAFARPRRLIPGLICHPEPGLQGPNAVNSPTDETLVATSSSCPPQLAIPVTVFVPLLGFDQENVHVFG